MKPVNRKVRSLAEDFLKSRNKDRSPKKSDVRHLAGTIQEAIELWFCAENEYVAQTTYSGRHAA